MTNVLINFASLKQAPKTCEAELRKGYRPEHKERPLLLRKPMIKRDSRKEANKRKRHPSPRFGCANASDDGLVKESDNEVLNQDKLSANLPEIEVYIPTEEDMDELDEGVLVNPIDTRAEDKKCNKRPNFLRISTTDEGSLSKYFDTLAIDNSQAKNYLANETGKRDSQYACHGTFSITEENRNNNKLSISLTPRSMMPVIFKAKEKRKIITTGLQDPHLSLQSRKDLERMKWVVDGILDHDLRPTILTEIATKYQSINEVPSGYMYPEFFMRR
jgi:hypothetical protein